MSLCGQSRDKPPCNDILLLSPKTTTKQLDVLSLREYWWLSHWNKKAITILGSLFFILLWQGKIFITSLFLKLDCAYSRAGFRGIRRLVNIALHASTLVVKLNTFGGNLRSSTNSLLSFLGGNRLLKTFSMRFCIVPFINYFIFNHTS